MHGTVGVRTGMFARLADRLFGTSAEAESHPACDVFVSLREVSGRSRIVNLRAQAGRPVHEQVDELLVPLHREHPGDGATILGISLSAEATSRWVVTLRGLGRYGEFRDMVVPGSSSDDAAIRALFAFAKGDADLDVDDIASLHDVAETIAAIEVHAVREEPASYEEFRGLVSGLAKGLRDGKDADQAGLADIESLLGRFPRAA